MKKLSSREGAKEPQAPSKVNSTSLKIQQPNRNSTQLKIPLVKQQIQKQEIKEDINSQIVEQLKLNNEMKDEVKEELGTQNTDQSNQINNEQLESYQQVSQLAQSLEDNVQKECQIIQEKDQASQRDQVILQQKTGLPQPTSKNPTAKQTKLISVSNSKPTQIINNIKPAQNQLKPVAIGTKNQNIQNQSQKQSSITKILNPKLQNINDKNEKQQDSKSRNNQQQIVEINKIDTIKNKYKFFEVFEDQIIDKIYLFLRLQDYAKLATLCHQARNKIPRILKLQNYSHLYSHESEYEWDEFQDTCQSIYIISTDYKNLIKKSLPEINECLQEFNKKTIVKKEVLREILLITTNFFMKANKKSNDICDYILEKGVQNIFKPLSYEYIKPSQGKLILPEFPLDAKNSRLSNLIRLITNYFKIQQKIKYPIEKQKPTVHKLEQEIYYKHFEQCKQRFFIKYNRPIYCLKSTSNVFDYINKNNIQLIIPFLNYKELFYLRLSNKTVSVIMKEAIANIIEKISHHREQELLSLNITDKQARAIMYLKHFKVISSLNQGLFSSNYFYEVKPIQKMLYTLCSVILKDDKEAEKIILYKKKGDNPECYYLDHDFHNAQSEKLGILQETLEFYNDNKVENDKINCIEYYRQQIIAFQKYLKGIQLYLELNLNRQNYTEIELKYNQKILSIDIILHKYERLFGLNKEILEALTFNFDKKQYQIVKKCKGRVFYLFQ